MPGDPRAQRHKARQRQLLAAIQRAQGATPGASSSNRNQAQGSGQGGKRKPVYTPSPVTPGSASGTGAQPVPPFMTGEDLIARGGAWEHYVTALNQIDSELNTQRIGSDYEKTGIDRKKLFDTRDTNDLMASRGLFHSSIRDSELWDIDASAAIRKRLLDDQLSAASIDAANRKLAAQGAWDSFVSGLGVKMVENAQESSPDAVSSIAESMDSGGSSSGATTRYRGKRRRGSK